MNDVHRPLDFRLLFESIPGLYVVLLPDAPNFTTIAVSDAYLLAARKSRAEVVGRSLFEVFPSGPETAQTAIMENLRASLHRVLATRAADTMPVQQYDLPRPEPEGGGFEEGFWGPINTPVLAPDGTVQFIIHRVENVTDQVLSNRELANARQLTRERQLLTLLAEHSPEFIGIADLNGTPVYANQAALTLIGARDLREVEQTAVPEYFVPEERAFVRDVVLPAVREKGRWQGELHLQHLKTGQAIPVHYDVFRVNDPSTGEPAHLATITHDLRGSKRAEAELRESDARFRTMADAAPVLIWISDASKQCHWFNHPWLEFTGRTLQQESVDGRFQSVHPDDLQRCVDIYNTAFDGREAFRIEYRLRRADGAWRWMLEHGIPLLGTEGFFTGYIGSCIDITERKEAEETLSESEARLLLLTELDDATRSLTNPREIAQAAAHLLGMRLNVNRCCYVDVEEDENTFKPSGDFNQGQQVIAGPYTFGQFGAGCLRSMQEGKTFIVVDSETHGGSVIFVPLLKAGRLVAALAIYQTTRREWGQNEIELAQLVANRCRESIEHVRVARELREREQRFRFLAESIPQMVWTAAPDGMLDYVNGQGSSYFGAEPKTLLGAGWLASVHPTDQERAAARWQQSLTTAEPYETAFRLRRGSDSTWRWHLVRALPLLGEAGNVLQWFGTCTDIEDQKQAEADLHHQWHTFDTALSHTPDFTYIFDLEGRFTYVNRALLSLWQRPLEDAVGKSFFELGYPPELAGRLNRQVQEVIGTKQPLRDQAPFTGPSGESRYYEYIFVPVLAANGNVEAVAGSTRDITERNRAEELIEEDRRRWRELLLQTPAAIAILRGPEHWFEWVNAAYVRLVGRPAEDLMGKTVLQAVPEVEGQTFVNLLNGVFRTGEPTTGHEALLRLQGDDGVLKDMYVNFVYLPTRDIAGEIDGIFVHATEVTDMVVARKLVEESERQFRTLAETIPHLTWMADETGHIFWYNRRWYEYTGTTLEDMQGWGWQKVHDPAVLPEVIEHWRGALASGEPFEMVFPLKGADGSFRTFLTRVEPVKDNEGRVVRWFGTNTDITEQRNIEQKLRRINRELEEFAYVASHDLQEPLRMVNIYTQLILKHFGGDDPTMTQYAAFIRQGVTHMESLIQDLLNFSRTVHAEELPAGTVNLSEALAEALSMLQNRIEEEDAIVTAESLPAVRGDTAQMAQVFQNLLSNALKYRSELSPRIEISAELDGENWIVAVRDNGIGFEPQFAERIFGLFKRLHKDEYPGTGLGLAICRRIVERYGGRMWAESLPGAGATFYFSLANVADR